MWQVINSRKTKRTFQVLFNLILWGMWVGLPLFSPVHQTHEVAHPHPHENPEFSEHIWVELITVMPLFYVITLLLMILRSLNATSVAGVNFVPCLIDRKSVV